jgi:hypothetical protein
MTITRIPNKTCDFISGKDQVKMWGLYIITVSDSSDKNGFREPLTEGRMKIIIIFVFPP